MKGNLVIVESPTKAKTIQKFLGEGYSVKYSKGHIRDLSENELGIDIDNGFKPEYVIPADKKKLVSELQKEAKDAQTVWLASDEDREGEAISWHLYETLGLKSENTKRIVFHEITKNAIQEAIQNPRDIDMNLVNAQQARRVLDRLVGFKLSPVLWRKIQPRLSAGRVQSVALRLIVDKEREILAFNKDAYYKVEATFHPDGTGENVTVGASLDKKFGTMDEARKFLEDCIGASFSVCDVEKKETTRCPAAPFTTSTLQQEASRKLHMSVSQTMSVAQGLYENGLITYMRTDSTTLSSLALGTAKKYITENFGEQYSKTRQFHATARGAQEAHEAIRPTFIDRVSIEGTPAEKKLYELIWKRTVASQMVEARMMKTDIKVASDKRDEKFCIQALQVLFDGFMKVYMESRDDDQQDDEIILPEIKTGTAMTEMGITASCKFTTAPQRYSEATLIKKLEELEIGRPSTYATIISTLTKSRGYIVKGDKAGEKIEVTNLKLRNGRITTSHKEEVVGAEKGRLLPQEIGILVTDYLVNNFGDIMDYDFTANVENDFDRIAAGEKGWSETISSFYGPFQTSVNACITNGEYGRVESRELGVDPQDGLMVVAKFGRHGAYVQKGDGDNKVYASLAPGQLVESITLEEALKLFTLPRTVGQLDGIDIICTKGRFGAYIKYGDKNISLPRGKNPVSVTADECIEIIKNAASKPAGDIIATFDGDITVINGAYGPYIKHDGKNYRIPKGTDAATLTQQDCEKIVSEAAPTSRNHRRR